ncbi:carbon-nitrogen hydrolase family protein [Thalassotalea mangrovi]|uniref:Carbon-nitrogen hydrolase family protein n=2 Tax=Thalassotalea mangrovi TaxID=2572245 RepID=A0A4U1BCJ9_9GAMM|nr:carbon-nitrogen hydrolase family protein [Thalassotalea mangrovi]
MTSVPDVDANFASIDRLLTAATANVPQGEPHLVVLPECCLFFGGAEKAQLQLAEPLGEFSLGSMQYRLAQLARKHRCNLLAGSVPTIANNGERFHASSLLFSDQGILLGDYQKLHLFDVQVNDNTKSYLESRYTEPGNKITVIDIGGVKVGLAICYDVRFPELFRALRQQGAQVICLPSAFTQVTGEAHWQPLLQARAIENQVYMVAAAQQGEHVNGRRTHGHAMVVDPWGECQVIKPDADGHGLVTHRYDQQLLSQVRESIPVAQHNRFSLTFNPK